MMDALAVVLIALVLVADDGAIEALVGYSVCLVIAVSLAAWIIADEVGI